MAANAFEQAQDFLARELPAGEFLGLFYTLLNELKHEYSKDECLPLFIDLPAAVSECVGDTSRQQDVQTFCVLLFAGINLLDDIADGDVSEHLSVYRTSQLQLAATTLLSALPLRCMTVFPAELASQISQLLGERMLMMANGQYIDLSNANAAALDFARIRKSVEDKSGAELALFAKLAALIAGASTNAQSNYEAFGLALGTALQLATDCFDVFQDDAGSDLRNGSRTLPICIYVNSLSHSEREQALALVRDSSTDGQARNELRTRMRAQGVLHQVAFLIEVERHKAIRLLEQAAPLATGKARLVKMIAQASLLPQSSEKA